MARPTTGYRLSNGKRVPGTTTIIGRFKESGALIYWAYKRGLEGVPLYEERDKAAELGTVVHEMAEEHIKGNEPSIPAYLEGDDRHAVESAYSAYREWFDNTHLTVVSQEMALVSEEHRFGGTPDAIAVDGKDRLVLIDFKTSNGIYSDYLYQLAAYRILWNENNPDRPLTGGSHLARFAKEHGDFSHHFFPNLDDAEKGFVLMRRLYDIDAVLKKRAK